MRVPFIALDEILSAEVLEFDAVAEHDIHIGEHGGSDARIAFLGPRRVFKRRYWA